MLFSLQHLWGKSFLILTLENGQLYSEVHLRKGDLHIIDMIWTLSILFYLRLVAQIDLYNNESDDDLGQKLDENDSIMIFY